MHRRIFRQHVHRDEKRYTTLLKVVVAGLTFVMGFLHD